MLKKSILYSAALILCVGIGHYLTVGTVEIYRWLNDRSEIVTAKNDKEVDSYSTIDASQKSCPSDQSEFFHDCFGTFRRKNGDWYVGEFKNDKMDGIGTYNYADGSKYIGGFKDDLRSGSGELTLTDGTIVKGEFHNGELVTDNNDTNQSVSVADGRSNETPDNINKTNMSSDSDICMPNEFLTSQALMSVFSGYKTVKVNAKLGAVASCTLYPTIKECFNRLVTRAEQFQILYGTGSKDIQIYSIIFKALDNTPWQYKVDRQGAPSLFRDIAFGNETANEIGARLQTIQGGMSIDYKKLSGLAKDTKLWNTLCTIGNASDNEFIKEWKKLLDASVKNDKNKVELQKKSYEKNEMEFKNRLNANLKQRCEKELEQIVNDRNCVKGGIIAPKCIVYSDHATECSALGVKFPKHLIME